MKGNQAKTNSERQAEFRENLALTAGKRLSVTIGREAMAALQVVQKELKRQEKPATKRAAIETALIDLAKWYTL